MVLVSKKFQFTMLPQVAAIRAVKRNFTKEVSKQVLRRSIVTTKNHLTYHCTNTIPSYQLNIGT